MTLSREVRLEKISVILAEENKVWSRECEKQKQTGKHLGSTYYSPSSFTCNPLLNVLGVISPFLLK